MASKPTYAERLDADRLRDGKEPFTLMEQVARLTKIRDGAVAWMESCVVAGKATGSGAARELHDYAMTALKEIENDAAVGEKSRIPWAYTDYPLDGMGPEASDTVN